MPTSVQGTLDEQDFSDTYSIWRRPGRYGYEFQVRGVGAVDLIVEARLSEDDGVGREAGSWEATEARPAIRGGSRITGTVNVPPARSRSGGVAPWIELRIRVVRVPQSKSVAYELKLESCRSSGQPPPHPP